MRRIRHVVMKSRPLSMALVSVLVLVAAAGSATIKVLAASAHTTPALRSTVRASSTPSARVGAFYFDGWAGPLSNFHFDGLAHPGPIGFFPQRRPLSGWRDNKPESLEAQLHWAHADGISFFVFDWFREDVDPLIDVAYHNYLKLKDHNGVGFALMYVGNGPFGIPLDLWPAVAEKWVTEAFLNPDYVRIDGKPLLIVYEINDAAQLWGGASGVNRGIDILQQTAKKHGLPGVFVVGTHQEPAEYTRDCFLTCGYDGDLLAQHWSALSKYTFNQDVKPVDGAIPYGQMAAAQRAIWSRYAQQSQFRFIPSVPTGWDERSSNELVRDSSGTPRLFWFTRTPSEVGGLVHDAIGWVNNNPQMRVEPAPAPPIVLIGAWNELQEGAYILPTDEGGYDYGKAIAQAVGIGWTAPPKHTLRVMPSARGRVTSAPTGLSCPPTCSATFDEGQQVTLVARAKAGSLFDHWAGCTETDPTCSVVLVHEATIRPTFLAIAQRRTLSFRLSAHLMARGKVSVRDGFSGCASFEQVQIERIQGGHWIRVASDQADELGRFAVKFRGRVGAYRAHVTADRSDDHTCLAASSLTVHVH